MPTWRSARPPVVAGGTAERRLPVRSASARLTHEAGSMSSVSRTLQDPDAVMAPSLLLRGPDHAAHAASDDDQQGDCAVYSP
jgi:hypothetical protein